MAETEVLFETRLIGAEDVNWDNSGTSEKTTFTDGNGVPHDSSLINAGHVPLPSTTRALLDNKSNVAAGMEVLADRIGRISGGSSSALGEDTTIDLDSTHTASAIQSTIDQQSKNLGGHTLTFLFSEGFDASLSSSLVFDGFYNGFLVIDLNEDTISDAADTGSVFHLHDCFCKVEVKNGAISHTLSDYGIKAERCPCVYLTELAFTSSGGIGNYAFYGIDTDGVITSCSYQNDKTKLISGVLAGLTEEHNSDDGAHSDLFASKAPLVSPVFLGTPTAPTAAAGTNTTQIATTAFVKTATDNHNSDANAHFELLKKYCPVGAILPFAGGTTPTGFLTCNGGKVSRTTYAALFAAIGTQYGEGDGSTTFALPDLRGKFLRGYYNGTTTAIGTAQAESLPDITGGYLASELKNSFGEKSALYRDGTIENSRCGDQDNNGPKVYFKASRCNSIYNGSHVIPANYPVLFIIKY